MSATVTACLITYRRPDNIGRIVSHLIQQPFIDRILIRDNDKGRNDNVWARYNLAENAGAEIVFTQDDDCIVRDIQRIYDAFIADPTRIAFGLHPSHFPIWSNYTFPECQLAMMGWGAFFKPEWIAPALNRYIHSVPHLRYRKDSIPRTAPNVDEFLDEHQFFRRETDRIFSLMMARQHNPLLTENLEHLPGASSGHAMSLETNHYASRAKAIERCRAILAGEV